MIGYDDDGNELTPSRNDDPTPEVGEKVMYRRPNFGDEEFSVTTICRITPRKIVCDDGTQWVSGRGFREWGSADSWRSRHLRKFDQAAIDEHRAEQTQLGLLHDAECVSFKEWTSEELSVFMNIAERVERRIRLRKIKENDNA